MRKEGREGSLFIWVQRGLNGHGKARQKTLAPPWVFFAPPPGGTKNLAPPRVSSLSAPKMEPPKKFQYIVHCIVISMSHAKLRRAGPGTTRISDPKPENEGAALQSQLPWAHSK